MNADKALPQSGIIRAGYSPHCSRTMMLPELSALLEAVPDAQAPRFRYKACVKQDNCLAKRSGSSRKLSFGYLARLYGLDPDLPVFRALRFFWAKDAASLPLLGLLCACSRDPLLRYSAAFILKQRPGAEISSPALAGFLAKGPGARFQQTTLNSASRNLRSTFTQSGHLKGHFRKFRSLVCATPASVAYALYLGNLEGLSGKMLFQSGYIALLDCDLEKAFEQAVLAAHKGWLLVKRIGDIIEIKFTEWR